VTDHRILQASLVPRAGKIEKCLTATSGLEDGALHDDILPDTNTYTQSQP